MQEEHQKLMKQFEESKKAIEKSKFNFFVLLLVVLIVCSMKLMQLTASLKLNAIATSAVFLLLIVHFWGFYPRRALYVKQTSIVLEGLAFEEKYPFLKLNFFRDHLREFSVLGTIISMLLFDFAFLYFGSVSFTQFIKKINPDFMMQIRSLKHFTTPLISFLLGWAYYQAIRPLANIKKARGLESL